MGPPLLIPGAPSRQEMASIVWPLRLVFSRTVGWSRDVCWCAGRINDLFSIKLQLSPKISPGQGSLSWMLLFHFSLVFQVCSGNLNVFQDLLLSIDHMLFQETDLYPGQSKLRAFKTVSLPGICLNWRSPPPAHFYVSPFSSTCSENTSFLLRLPSQHYYFLLQNAMRLW